ncbi:glycosyltransferase family 61 protein [Hansschlegelia sp. KR7-227]|uniref:glycosyltransferase family 61 protein n=1 Tax=Hansschlegelia sp. KR7-227 TaxID=3400914 RepID=UPI003C097BD0
MTVPRFTARDVPPNRLNGDVAILSGPRVSVSHNAVYHPVSGSFFNGSWGLTDYAGGALPLSIPLRGRGERPFGHVDRMPMPSGDFDRRAGTFFYLGPIFPHFGHFLIESLNRMWALGQCRSTIDGVVCHANEDVPELLTKRPFMRDLLVALGVGEGDLIRPSRPTIFEALVIPEPAMQPRAHVYHEFAEMFSRARIAMGIKPPDVKKRNGVYISKTKIKHGVTLVSNEQFIENTMRDHGYDVVYPEDLTFKDQITTFDAFTDVVGCAGSAFHTLLLSAGNKRLRYIAPGDVVNSNYPMIDIALGHDATYFFPSVKAITREGIMFPFEICNVEKLTDAILSHNET